MDHNKSRKLILAVDDEPGILRIISASLRVYGYDVVTSCGGKEALELVESEKPDLILLDVLMPEMDGFETLEKLRVYSKLPVVVFSAHISSRDQALQLGANDFLSKPFTPEQIEKKISAVLQLARNGGSNS